MEDNKPKSTSEFLRNLMESRRPITKLSDKGDFVVSNQALGSAQRLFIVEHPVTIKWSSPDAGGVTCIKVASYSLFPVSVGQEYCIR
jgi:hypothetical protein